MFVSRGVLVSSVHAKRKRRSTRESIRQSKKHSKKQSKKHSERKHSSHNKTLFSEVKLREKRTTGVRVERSLGACLANRANISIFKRRAMFLTCIRAQCVRSRRVRNVLVRNVLDGDAFVRMSHTGWARVAEIDAVHEPGWVFEHVHVRGTRRRSQHFSSAAERCQYLSLLPRAKGLGWVRLVCRHTSCLARRDA